MKAIGISTGSKVVKTIMDGVSILALTGVGVLGWQILSIHKRVDKVEFLDNKIADELEEYFRYSDEQRKKVEAIKRKMEA
jgi:hypothetical protein